MPALLSYAEVLNWIAFKQITEESVVGSCCCDDCDPGILHVLESRAEGRPVWINTPPPEGTPDWAIVNLPSRGLAIDIERAKRLVLKRASSNAVLADEMRPKVDAWTARRDQWKAAISTLTEAIVSGLVTQRNAPNTGAYADRSSPDGTLVHLLPGLQPGWFSTEEVYEIWPKTNAVEKKPLPQPWLLDFWRAYVGGFKNDDRMPNAKDGRVAIEVNFPNHSLSARQYSALRASGITPASWRKQGRRKSKHHV